MAILETKIDSAVASSESFPETCQYNVSGRTENFMVAEWCFSSIRIFRTCPCLNLRTTWNQLGIFICNKISHYVASWYRHSGGSGEEFQLFHDQLDIIRTKHKGNKLPSLNKSGSVLCQSEGQRFIDVMNDHGLEQLVQSSLGRSIHLI